MFEANIRLLGGLLSAHLLASDSTLGLMRMPYHGQLLTLATDLGDRLMEAFRASPTGLVCLECVHTHVCCRAAPLVTQSLYLLAGCHSAAFNENPVLVPHYAFEFCSSLPAECCALLDRHSLCRISTAKCLPFMSRLAYVLLCMHSVSILPSVECLRIFGAACNISQACHSV